MTLTPAYTHDCTACIFVGQDEPRRYEPQSNIVDLYVHDYGRRLSLIRRFSSDGPDYRCVTVGIGERPYEASYGIVLDHFLALPAKTKP